MLPPSSRVPFAIAISEPDLLKKPWQRLTLPQQVVLKAAYGLPLVLEKELLLWSAMNGAGEFDELGYLTGITHEVPYEAKEYSIITGLFGRRSGKSSEMGGFGGAYEITLGGHPTYARPGQEIEYIYVAQDLANATKNMKGIVLTLRQSPMLKQAIVEEGVEQIRFHNDIFLRAQAANVKASRGSAIMGATLDELGFWYKDAKAANPDIEVEIAIAYAMQQFEPWAKQWRFTTPWTKEGLAYEASLAGTEGRHLRCEECRHRDTCDHLREEVEKYEDHLVLHAPTATMAIPEPLVTRAKLARKRKRDPEAFERESLARFTDTQGGFLSHALVEAAVVSGLTARAHNPAATYVAALDPAFRRDEFALTIGHHDAEWGVVQDYLKVWTPEVGGRLNPATILDEVKTILEAWDLSVAWSDQAQLESLQQLALDRDFTIIGFDLTVKSKPKMMGNLATHINQGKLKLLDHKRQTLQLKQLQKTVTPSGHVSIAAPPGKHDDLAMVLALMASQAIHLPTLSVNERTVVATTREGERTTKAQFLARLAADFEAGLAAGDPTITEAAERYAYLSALTDPITPYDSGSSATVD